MIKLLKTFGRGILYVIGFPFFVVTLLIFAVIGVFLFLYQIVKSVIDFFTGRKFFPELPEDRELRMKMEAAEAASQPQNQVVGQSNDDIIIPLIEEEIVKKEEPVVKETTIEEAVFLETPKQEVVEEKIEEPEEDDVFKSLLINEPLQREEPQDTIDIVEEREIKTAPTKEIIVEDDDLEEYIPGGSSYSEDIDDDEEDTKGGVRIDFDL